MHILGCLQICVLSKWCSRACWRGTPILGGCLAFKLSSPCQSSPGLAHRVIHFNPVLSVTLGQSHQLDATASCGQLLMQSSSQAALKPWYTQVCLDHSTHLIVGNVEAEKEKVLV